VTVVELDGAIVDIAEKHFGLRIAGGAPLALGARELPYPAPGEVAVVVGDGIAHVRNLAADLTANHSHLPDVVLIDTDAKDISSGMSFPPAAFLSPQFLGDLSCILRPRCGRAVFNVAARSRALFDGMVSKIRSGFNDGCDAEKLSPVISCAAIDEADLNCLVSVRTTSDRPDSDLADTLATASVTAFPATLAPPVQKYFARWAPVLSASGSP
jgi:hypothetical protein